MKRFFILLVFIFTTTILAGASVPGLIHADDQCSKLQQQFNDFTQSGNSGGAPQVLSDNCYSAGGAINKGVGIALVFAGTLAVLFIIIGAIQYMTAAGSESRSASGKKTMLWATIGLVVIILASTVVIVVSQFVIGK